MSLEIFLSQVSCLYLIPEFWQACIACFICSFPLFGASPCAPSSPTGVYWGVDNFLLDKFLEMDWDKTGTGPGASSRYTLHGGLCWQAAHSGSELHKKTSIF